LPPASSGGGAAGEEERGEREAARQGPPESPRVGERRGRQWGEKGWILICWAIWMISGFDLATALHSNMHLYDSDLLGRLFIMLKYFPIESKGRQQKLREVGRVASICFCCFLAQCIMVRIFVHWKLCRFSSHSSFMKFALYLLCRCVSMHLTKKLTSMFLTIQF